MNYVKNVNVLVWKVGFTAVRQTPIRPGYDGIVLLSLTDQQTRKNYPGIRVTAKADRHPRGWKERDVYRMYEVVAYAAEIKAEAHVVIAASLRADEEVRVVTARQALVEAVQEISARLEAKASRPGADSHRAQQESEWWKREHRQTLEP